MISSRGRQVARRHLALIIATPPVVLWMARSLHPLAILFVLLVLLDIGAFVGAADSRSKGDWNRPQ